MLIWRGSGIVVVASVVVFATLQMVLNAVMYDGYYQGHAWPKIVAALVCAIPLWLYGRAVNHEPPQVVVDPKNPMKRTLIPAKKHDFLFVPVEYWGVVVLLVGGYLAYVTVPTAAPAESIAEKTTRQAANGLTLADLKAQAEARQRDSKFTPQQVQAAIAAMQQGGSASAATAATAAATDATTATSTNPNALPVTVIVPGSGGTTAASSWSSTPTAAPSAWSAAPTTATYLKTPVEKAKPTPEEQALARKRAEVAATMTAEPEIEATAVEQVYVDNATKLYYTDDCAARPNTAYHMPKRMAVQQKFRAAGCH